MTELVESALPGLETDEEISGDAPYGRKADGTPRQKPGRPKGSTNTGGSTSARIKLDKDEIADLLVEKISIPVAAYSPLASFVIDDRADKTAEALMVLADYSPRIKKALAKARKYGAVAELALLPLAIATAVLVEFGRLSATSQVAVKFNLDIGWERLYGQNGSEDMQSYRHANGSQEVKPRTGLL